jgi:hypothetical protein
MEAITFLVGLGADDFPVDFLGRPHHAAGRVDPDHNRPDGVIFTEAFELFDGIAGLRDNPDNLNHTHLLTVVHPEPPKIRALHPNRNDQRHENKGCGKQGGKDQKGKQKWMSAGKHWLFAFATRWGEVPDAKRGKPPGAGAFTPGTRRLIYLSSLWSCSSGSWL